MIFVNNNDISNLMNMLSKMDKNQLANGLNQLNQMLSNEDKQKIKSPSTDTLKAISMIGKPCRRVLSLFSGCGGMDVGFEGGFTCLKRSINTEVHPEWICKNKGVWAEVIKTGFNTVFANDIRPDAKAAWVSYFQNRFKDADSRYHLGRDRKSVV